MKAIVTFTSSAVIDIPDVQSQKELQVLVSKFAQRGWPAFVDTESSFVTAVDTVLANGKEISVDGEFNLFRTSRKTIKNR